MPATELDVRGFNCPIPVLRTRRALEAMTTGQELRVLATDPAAEIDFKHLCNVTPHELLNLERADGELRFLIRRGGA